MKLHPLSVVAANIDVTPDSLWNSSLWEPAREFLSRPRKDIRAELVRLGFALYSPALNQTQEQKISLDILAQSLEWIHAGSLIIDDIEDDSLERRGGATLHRLYGVPKALNLGNWMYFEALEQFHQVPLTGVVRLRLLECAHAVMRRAHLGQALDLGASMTLLSRNEIPTIVRKSHELKSGALVALALQVGALVADAEADLMLLDRLGTALGASLQRFDDLGNLKLHSADVKALEDLRLARPSWVWKFLALHASTTEFRDFVEAVLELPDQQKLVDYLVETGLKQRAFAEALRLHADVERDFQTAFCGPEYLEVLNQLKKVTERIAHAYK